MQVLLTVRKIKILALVHIEVFIEFQSLSGKTVGSKLVMNIFAARMGKKTSTGKTSLHCCKKIKFSVLLL